MPFLGVRHGIPGPYLGGGAGSVFGMPKWTAAMAAALAGTRNAKLLTAGNSTTAGYNSQGAGYANCRAGSYPVQLAQNQSGTPPWKTNSVMGLTTSGFNSGGINSWDPRLLVNTGTAWGGSSTLWSVGGYSLVGASTGSIGFTPTQQCDTFDIYYPNNGAGVCTVNINGGATLATITQDSGGAFSKITVTGTLGNNTLNFVWVSGSPQIFWIIGTNSAVKEISVLNAGMSGTKIANWVTNTAAWDVLNAIPTLAPDLTVIDLTINDWNVPTSLPTFVANTQLLINAAKVSGDVILMTGNPSQVPPGAPSDATAATQQTFVTAYAALAKSNQINLVDIYDLFGSWTAANAKLWMADNLHCYQVGYQQISNALAPVIGASPVPIVTFDQVHIGTLTLSNGGLTATGAGGTNWQNAVATSYKSAGKYYDQVLVNSTTSVDIIGLVNASAALSAAFPGVDLNGIGWSKDGRVLINATVVATINTWVTGSLLGRAVDLDNKMIWFRVNGGNWNNSGTANPATNTGGISISSLNAGPYATCVSADAVGVGFTDNWGALAYSQAAPANFGKWG